MGKNARSDRLLHSGLDGAATICCNALMDLSIEQIVEAGGVSAAYARMLIAGTRSPSLELALKLYDATGAKVGPLVGLNKSGIEAARQMEATRQASKAA